MSKETLTIRRHISFVSQVTPSPVQATEEYDVADASPDICGSTARSLAAALQRRELSAREVVEAHLAQIDRLNPTVNAVVTLLGEEAMDAARRADELTARGEDVGPLHGLPIAHKDTSNTKGIRTTFGSLVFADHIPTEDHLIVERLRQAGAITTGKTNVPEFGAGSHTFNALFGATRNPYDTSRSSGGSSGGAAAALATGMQPLADGSDMGGSLRNPAAWCNVVGLRPSPGRIPAYPTDAAWGTISVQGPMARTVSDVAFMMSVVAGPDDRSPISIDQPAGVFAEPLDRDLTGRRVAWSPDFGGTIPVEPVITDALARQVKVFEDLGCAVDETSPDWAGAEEVWLTLRAWQFEQWYGELLDHKRELLKPSLVWNIECGRALTAHDVGRAETLHTALYHRMREFFTHYDVLLLPVTQVEPFDVDLEYPADVAGVSCETYLDWQRSCYLVSATGSPAISVPAGFTPSGLPVGLQIVGRHRADLDVLQVAYAFEQATRFGERRPALLTGPTS